MSKNTILFVCNQNSVRSPMAAALLRTADNAGGARIDSAGVYEGGPDPFAQIVMGELDVDMHAHAPKGLDEIDLAAFDRIIALTPEAAIALRDRSPEACIEFWDIENPSQERGGRDAVIEAYRRVRDEIARRLEERFPEFHQTP